MKKMILFLVVLSVLCGAMSVRAEGDKPHVNLLMSLAIDVSGSIKEDEQLNEFQLQKQGLLQALRDSEVARLLKQCNADGIAMNYTEWSAGSGAEPAAKELVSWTHLKDEKDLQKFAENIEKTNRSSHGDTDLIAGLHFAASTLQNAPFLADRKVIAVSSDGVQSVYQGPLRDLIDVASDVADTRDSIVRQHIRIDALVLTTDQQNLYLGGNSKMSIVDYYENFVKGGQGSFVRPVENFNQYGEVMTEQLRRELSNCYM